MAETGIAVPLYQFDRCKPLPTHPAGTARETRNGDDPDEHRRPPLADDRAQGADGARRVPGRAAGGRGGRRDRRLRRVPHRPRLLLRRRAHQSARCRSRSATRSAAASSPPAHGAEGWIGKSVIVPAVLPCGECDLCKRGLSTICRTQKMPGNDIQGGFATAHRRPRPRPVRSRSGDAWNARASRSPKSRSSPTH